MISQDQPEFSGSQDEDVEIFIRQCRYKWVSPADFKASLKLDTRDAAMDDAIVTTIRAGCTEIARDYINLLDLEVIDDLDRLCDALRQRFPRLDKKAMITRQVEKLKQRHEIGDYIEEGLHLAKELNSIRGGIKHLDERELVDKWESKIRHRLAGWICYHDHPETMEDMVKTVSKYSNWDSTWGRPREW